MMYGSFLLKELKQLFRDRSELLVLLLMPIVLITILGNALSGMISPGGTSGSEVTGAVVLAESLEEELARFEDRLEADGVPEGMKQEIMAQAEVVSVPEQFVEMLDTTSEVSPITVDIIRDGEIDEEAYNGVWYFEEGYREAAWRNMFLQEGEAMPLHVDISSRSAIFTAITKGFFREFNNQKELAYVASINGEEVPMLPPVEIDTREVDNRTILSAFDYYTVGMAMMFVLYSGTFLAGVAHVERQTHVYQRILLTNVPIWLYLSAKGGAGALLASIQLVILFLFSSLVFGVEYPNLGLISLLGLGMVLFVGALTMFLTSLNFRLQNAQASALFSGAGITILAFLGGSFFNVGQISETVARIGQTLPNGAAMQGILTVMGGGGIELLYPFFLSLVGSFLVLAVLSVMIFPREEVR
ncbi:ABC transporter permease [Paenalkalicoccus suaedae]|uniref:ABC transporter permease n=1 Tax=Paenalkalicoccus suaedae TaxID=2592382 RepID=A0A859FBD6_9BACI|nr:ABC transporter permease [Paenalkalicoccus suaedae]QKS70347.1 ABC transporter permease [Paenalkalicoccus suaedae]